MQEATARTLLKQRVSENYEAYRAQWLRLSPAELIDRCEELEAVTRMAKELSRAASEENAAYLLRFQNPLEVVSDEWISRNGIDTLVIDDEMIHLLWSLQDSGEAEQFYDLEPEYADASEGPDLTM